MLCCSLMVWTLTFGSSCFALYNVNSCGETRLNSSYKFVMHLLLMLLSTALILLYLAIFKVSSCCAASLHGAFCIAVIKTCTVYFRILSSRNLSGDETALFYWPQHFGRFCPQLKE